MISGENPVSVGQNGVESQVIKEIQISRQMTIYGQKLGGFKRESNECFRNGEKTKLHKIKFVGFLIFHVRCYKSIPSRITSL